MDSNHSIAAVRKTSKDVQKCDGGGGGWAGDAALLAAAFILTVTFAQTAYRVSQQPWDLAFVVLAYLALALLFWCLRRFDRLAPESPAGDRDRLKLAVWVLSTALSVAFAWRVGQVVPLPMRVAVWVMTMAVALAGFCGLVVYKRGDYRELDNCHELSPEEV